MTKPRLLLFTATLAAAISAAQANAAEGVVASVKPIHSLVAAVMEGVGTPELLVKGAGSPHTYSMRPSEAGLLEEAKVVFWVGPDLEIFLEKPLQSLAGDARVVTLSQTPGITLLGMREGGAFEAHAHDEDEHHEHEAGEDHHDHEAHGDHEANEDHEGHAHGGSDMHLWLDPENARRMVKQIAATLAEADPDNRAAYQRNAAALDARFDALLADIAGKLAPVRGKPFIIFHDAYQYFEHRFDIPATGSITVSPEALPGARRLGEIRDRIREVGAICVFTEPQFEPKLVQVVTDGTDARSGVLDPLGADLEDGPELYFTLVGRLADSLASCLSGGE